jgi:RNA polymerase sigma factor (TIGR02999 family)
VTSWRCWIVLRGAVLVGHGYAGMISQAFPGEPADSRPFHPASTAVCIRSGLKKVGTKMNDLYTMNESVGAAQITRLLHQWQDGSRDAFERLVPLVYDELHTLASRQLAHEWRHDRLQTTAVVNEAYVKLFGQRDIDWQNRGHFFAIAAHVMRRILVDHARRERRQKRGGGSLPVELNEAVPAPGPPIDAVDALDLDRALAKLEQLDPHQGRIVELRFFGGLTIEETAASLGVSPATVKREWSLAKGWLHRELTGNHGGNSQI